MRGSAFDTPITAHQERAHRRQGFIGSVTHLRNGHNLKAGIEASRVTPREFFSFAITDPQGAEEREVSEEALVFTPANPFIFRDRRVGGYASWYLQDSFAPVRNFTISAGLRFDRSSLPLSENQFSPRIGVVYHFPSTETAIRASFNRLYQPPQIENLLLSVSDQARRLSPFADESSGGVEVRAERVSAYEVGAAQDFAGLIKLDAAVWYRHFRNFDDPNVFFNTTIIFPNSVSSGFAKGLDVRLDVPERNGWSGYLSYTNQRILQTGPINGGLFLTDEFGEIGPGVSIRTRPRSTECRRCGSDLLTQAIGFLGGTQRETRERRSSRSIGGAPRTATEPPWIRSRQFRQGKSETLDRLQFFDWNRSEGKRTSSSFDRAGRRECCE